VDGRGRTGAAEQRKEEPIMTTFRAGLVVVLNADVPDEDVEAIAAAIRLIRGVASVKNVEGEPDAQVDRERLNAEWRQRIVGLLDDEGV
jgi:hypothetical protein